MDQSKVWDILAPGWYNWRAWPIRAVGDLSEGWKPGKILDIGCGNCRNLVPFLKKGFKGVGLDFSEGMLEGAKKMLEKNNVSAQLKLGRIEKLPFVSESFDYCLFVASLHHLKEDMRKEALKEMKRVLKKKGKALITVWISEKKGVKEKDVSWSRKGVDYKRYYYFFDKKELKDLIEDVGFEVIKSWEDKKNLIFIVEK